MLYGLKRNVLASGGAFICVCFSPYAFPYCSETSEYNEIEGLHSGCIRLIRGILKLPEEC
jgi:hypothetical protein